MEAFIALLSSYGYWGMLAAAFLAGSFIPFSSEAVMVGLIAAGLDPTELFCYATVGNTLGSVLNYYVGRLGKMEWIEHYLYVSQQSLHHAQRFLAGRGAWMGFFAFIPVLGSAISIALGLMRANRLISFASFFLGKLIRYGAVLLGAAMLL